VGASTLFGGSNANSQE